LERHPNAEQLPRSDLKSVRLVNKQWSAIAATVLWSHLATDLPKPETPTHSLDTLLGSYPNGFLDNIKKITTTDKPPSLMTLRATLSLLKSLGALPRDCLRLFSSRHHKLDRIALCLLLRTQSQIGVMILSLGEDEPRGLPGATYVRGNLSNLHKLHLLVRDTLQGLTEWCIHAPALRDLHVEHADRGDLSHFAGWATATDSVQLKLRSLKFTRLDLSSFTPDVDTSLLDLAFLERITFERCVSAGPLMRSLTKGYKTVTTSSLKYFRSTSSFVPEDVCRATEELFELINGLEHIILGRTATGLPSLTCLQRSSASLKLVDFEASNERQIYSPAELEQFNSCIHLKNIRLSISELRSVVDVLGPFEPCKLSAFQHLEESLVSHSFMILVHLSLTILQATLARHPTLQTLIITSNPLLSYDIDKGKRRWRYAQLAEQMLAYLADHGSKVQQLGFSPKWGPGGTAETSERDENGNRWPVYIYKRGTVSVDQDGKQQIVKVTAVPWRKDDNLG
jgi:hypothetical protein